MWLVGLAWQRGWQPSELARHARRRDPRLAPIVSALIHADDDRRDPSTLHPQWSAQIEAIADDRVAAIGWLGDLIDIESADDIERLSLVVAALALLATLPSSKR